MTTQERKYLEGIVPAPGLTWRGPGLPAGRELPKAAGTPASGGAGAGSGSPAATSATTTTATGVRGWDAASSTSIALSPRSSPKTSPTGWTASGRPPDSPGGGWPGS